MYTNLTMTEPLQVPSYRHGGSVSGAICAWELKNRALNRKGFVTCQKSYSEFLL